MFSVSIMLNMMQSYFINLFRFYMS